MECTKLQPANSISSYVAVTLTTVMHRRASVQSQNWIRLCSFIVDIVARTCLDRRLSELCYSMTCYMHDRDPCFPLFRETRPSHLVDSFMHRRWWLTSPRRPVTHRPARINSHQHHKGSWHMVPSEKIYVSSCNLHCRLIFCLFSNLS